MTTHSERAFVAFMVAIIILGWIGLALGWGQS